MQSVWVMNLLTNPSEPNKYTQVIGVASNRQAAINEMAAHFNESTEGWKSDVLMGSGCQYSWLRSDQTGHILEVRETPFVG